MPRPLPLPHYLVPTEHASSRLLSAVPRNPVSIICITPTVDGNTELTPRRSGLETIARTIGHGSLPLNIPPSIWNHTMTVTRESADAGGQTPKGNTIGDENPKAMVLHLVLRSPGATRGEGFLQMRWHG